MNTFTAFSAEYNTSRENTACPNTCHSDLTLVHSMMAAEEALSASTDDGAILNR